MTDAADKPHESTGENLPETHSYVRHNMQLWMQWFTFFVTINYVALGWFAADLTHHQIEDRRPLILVAALFAFQCLLGIWVSLRLRKWFLGTEHLTDAAPSGSGRACSPQINSSVRLYAFAVLLSCLALASIAMMWVVLAKGAYTRNPSTSVLIFSVAPGA
jgi:hypothetical protein